jgi:hypothetical protein
VAGQVDAAPHELLAYGTRAQTRSDHLHLVLTHLQWRRVGDSDREQLAGWLVQRAVEHDAPATLMVLVAEHLRARRLLRPPVDALARMIATARANAHRHVELLLADQLAPERCVELDALLDGAAGQSGVADLRRRAARTGVKELLGQVQQYRRLVALGAMEIDVSALPPARRRALEALGRRMTAQQLRRLEPARRHPLLLVLLHALVIERGDELLDQFDSCCASAMGAQGAASTTSVARLPASATSSPPSDISSRGSCWSAPRPASCRWSASATRSASSGCRPRLRSSPVSCRRSTSNSSSSCAAATATCAPRCTPSWTRSL